MAWILSSYHLTWVNSQSLITFLPVIRLFLSMQIDSWQPNESGLLVVCEEAQHHHHREESLPEHSAPSGQHARLWFSNTVTIDKAMAHLKRQKDGPEQFKMQDDADGGSSCDGEASVSSLVNTQNHWNLILTLCVELSVHETPLELRATIFCLPTGLSWCRVRSRLCGSTAPYSADHDFGLMSSEFKATLY